MQKYIDTHSHVSDEAYGNDAEIEQVIARALEAGVFKMIVPDIDGKERARMREVCRRHPGVLYPMAGLYPGSVTALWRDEVDAVERSLREGGITAIGEIGLDYHWSKDFAALQKDAFAAQLELAAQYYLPVNIHLRDATEDFFSVMQACRHLGLRGNMHAFSGSYETFRMLQSFGDWRIGIGGVVTFKKASLQDVVREVPLDRMLLETDAPYLAPTPLRGTRNESANIPLVAAKIAELQGVSIDTVAEVTTAGAIELFGLQE